MQGLLDVLQGASNAAAANVTGPVDGMAWLLRKFGLPIPDAPVASTQWMYQQGLMREPQDKTMGLLGDTIGNMAPIPFQANKMNAGLLSTWK